MELQWNFFVVHQGRFGGNLLVTNGSDVDL